MLVMDCNAVVNIILGTQEGVALRQLILEGEAIVAPDLLVSELTNVLSKYVRGGHISRKYAQELLGAGLELVDTFVDDRELCLEAMNESAKLDHSSYDMFYFVLARRNGATLMTLDKKLQQLCADNDINCVFTDEGFWAD